MSNSSGKGQAASSAADSHVPYVLGDIRQHVFGEIAKARQYDPRRKNASKIAADLVISILSAALSGLRVGREDWSLDFLELFREAIGDVAERFNDYFQSFSKSLESNDRQDTAQNRREEVALGIQIADIIDELHMLESLFETQIEVLRQAQHLMPSFNVVCLHSLLAELKKFKEGLEVNSLQVVRRMIAETERIQKNLMNLLDLQQKEGNLYEAQSANQQALFAAKQVLSAQDQVDATNAQSQIIVIFTVVTIFFLPLSFFTSFYGMNILDKSSATGEGINYDRAYVYKVTFGVSLPIIIIILFGSYIWFSISKKQSKKKYIEYLARLKADGDLPRNLISPTDPIYSDVEQKARYMRPRNKY